MLFFFIAMIFQSCVVHSAFPYVCFLKECRQMTGSERKYVMSKRVNPKEGRGGNLEKKKGKIVKHKGKSQKRTNSSKSSPPLSVASLPVRQAGCYASVSVASGQ